MAARWAFLFLLIAGPVAMAEPACEPGVVGQVCTCDVTTLRPLEGALGRAQVEEQRAYIAARREAEWDKLKRDPVKVVAGPDGQLFILDHHHTAEAWRRLGVRDLFCEVSARPFTSTEDFWDGLRRDGLVRLADAQGRPVTPADLPTSLEAMPDDPYRTLAGRLRRAGVYCRPAAGEFFEFRWADWLRTKPELPADQVRAAPDNMLPVAAQVVDRAAGDTPPGHNPTRGACPKGE